MNLDQKFNFAEFIIGGITNRNNISEIDKFQLNGNRVDCYRSLYDHSENLKFWVHKTGSVKQYSDDHISNYLVFDFDAPKDYLQQLPEVKNEVVNFCLKLIADWDIIPKTIQVFFSGCRGFGVAIPMSYFGAIKPSPDFAKICKGIASDITSDTKFVDHSIYQTVHVIRIPNSQHSKSGLFKIPLSLDELQKLSIEQIQDLAKAPRYDLPHTQVLNVKAIPGLVELYRKWSNRQIKDTKSSKVKQPFESSIRGVGASNRNSTAISLCGEFVRKQFDEQHALEYLRLWNDKNTPPLDDYELSHIVEKSFRQYGSASSQVFDIKDVYSIKTASQVYLDYCRNLDKLKVNTGFPTIDAKLRGIMPGQTVCIQGKTSVGKSAVIQNIGHNHAKQSGEPVLFFSMEMPIESVVERAIQVECNITGYDVEDLFKMQMSIPEQALLTFKKLPNFYTITKTGLDLDKIEQWVKFAEEHVYHKKTSLILLDYLGLVKGKGNNFYEQMSSIGRGIKDKAKEMNVPIIFLSQTTKGKSDYDDLDLDSTRDSGSITEAADYVISVTRRSEDIHGTPEAKLTLSINKNRKGGLVKVPIIMDRRSLRTTEDQGK